ncbi:hypothetical protein Tsubulata_035676 [Turnera subulata]|uniref:DUF4283 domain-containing protein n=1 Tax=Turnera subulata TaxID=218843 RepID=A0A9Q0G2S7_9ROSI|nr:hypothetical protein Tsubulata_035676 [Turnera subulata]
MSPGLLGDYPTFLPHLQSANSNRTAEKVYIPKDQSPTWFDRCAFAVLKNPIPLHSLTAILTTNFTAKPSIVPIGGVSFLIKFPSTEALRSVLAEKPIIVDQIFREFRAWHESDTASDRLCWVLIRGTPPSLWNLKFFRAISAHFGSLVDCSSETTRQSRLDVAKVLILTSNFAFINRHLSIQVAGKEVKVGIIETQYDPLDWEWSSSSLPIDRTPTASPSDHRAAHRHDPSSSSLPTQPVLSPLSCNQSDESKVSSSQDPFNLRPVINKVMHGHALPSHSLSQNSKQTPSELSENIPGSVQNMTHSPTNPHVPPPSNSNQLQCMSSPTTDTSEASPTHEINPTTPCP